MVFLNEYFEKKMMWQNIFRRQKNYDKLRKYYHTLLILSQYVAGGLYWKSSIWLFIDIIVMLTLSLLVAAFSFC